MNILRKLMKLFQKGLLKMIKLSPKKARKMRLISSIVYIFFYDFPPPNLDQMLNERIYKPCLKDFGPGGLRAPCVLACAMRSLAIVFTIVQSFSLSFFFFFSLRLLLLTHFGESPVCENLFPPIFWHI